MEGKLKNSVVNGTLIWYYYVCRREVWLISHGIEPPESEAILAGRLIHQAYYRRYRKELLIDNKIKVDLLENRKVVGEVKKSSRYFKSAKMQLAFYLYYFEVEKGEKLEGELLIPEERKRIRLALTDELRKELEKAVREIEKIASMPSPPPIKRTKYCRNCAYRELCWS